METIVLKNIAKDGSPLSATFAPEKGMNLISYKKGDVEIIDQSTTPLFDERAAGLGALIGPHFHRRNPKTIHFPDDLSLFPHLKLMKDKGVEEPFSHGIARYVPWTYTANETSLQAKVSGKDEWKGVPLKELEGQDFSITLQATLIEKGLNISLSIVSESDSLLGFHYYYALPKKKGLVKSHVKANDSIPCDIKPDDLIEIALNGAQDIDWNFHPVKNPCGSTIELNAEDYTLSVSYKCPSEENSWQLYHPKDASFVCIEPISAANPKKPQLTVSSIDMNLEIETHA